MLARLILVSVSWLAVAGCSANAQLNVPSNLNTSQPNRKLNIPADNLASAALDKQVKANSSKVSNSGVDSNLSPPGELNNSVSNNTANSTGSKANSKSQKVSVGPGGISGSYMTLTPTGQANQLGNPLYELRLFTNGQQVASYITVSGRAYTQEKDRNRSGTEAPLPDGRYKVAKNVTRGTIPEAGDRFLGLQPTFSTGRTALGIHYDPSFNKNNGEDGTSGCIALTNREDLNQVLEYVRNYRPQFLKVSIKI
ncbi:MAG: L,D-transpeptidase family protein [Calothrix sp. CSU_2_0]|nr:L,D-transpeptidase family protein [Calothrix sp. CSU_2_0]